MPPKKKKSTTMTASKNGASKTTTIPWARGFCLPTAVQRKAAAGSFPVEHAAAATQHRCSHLDQSSLHGSIHAAQMDHAVLFEPPVCPLPALHDDQDWLAQVAEPGQSFDQYLSELSLRSGRWTSRTGAARTGGLLLVPIGLSLPGRSGSCHPVKNDESVLLEELRRYLFAFLGESTPVQLSEPAYLKRISNNDTRVEWIPPRGSSGPNRMVTARQHDAPAHIAVNAESILTCLTDLTSMCTTSSSGNSQPHSVVGVLTSTDLYSTSADLFIAGLAAGASHVAAFSLHRYHPHIRMSPIHWWKYGYANRSNAYSYFEEVDYESIEIKDDDDDVAAATTTKASANPKKRSRTLRLSSTPPAVLMPRSQREFLTRAVKLFSHEVLHLFLLGHCIYHACLMNGTAHLVEDFAAPPHLCGIDLRKLQFRLGFDVVRRYEALADIWTDWGCKAHAQWCRKQARQCRRAMQTKDEENE